MAIWYLSANPESHDYSEEPKEKNALFGKELGSLYKRFLKSMIIRQPHDFTSI